MGLAHLGRGGKISRESSSYRTGFFSFSLAVQHDSDVIRALRRHFYAVIIDTYSMGNTSLAF